MPHYVGLDVSQKTTAICIVDKQGRRLWRGVCATDPGALSARISQHAGVDAKVGIETGSMTPWLVHGLRSAGLDVQCLDARRVNVYIFGKNTPNIIYYCCTCCAIIYYRKPILQKPLMILLERMDESKGGIFTIISACLAGVLAIAAAIQRAMP